MAQATCTKPNVQVMGIVHRMLRRECRLAPLLVRGVTPGDRTRAVVVTARLRACAPARLPDVRHGRCGGRSAGAGVVRLCRRRSIPGPSGRWSSCDVPPGAASLRKAAVVSLHGRGFVLRGFAVSGVFWGAFAAVLPDLQRTAVVTDGELGLGLGALALAALPVMPMTGRFADQRGGVEALQVALVASALSLPLVAFASGRSQLLVALLALGATTGALDVALNAAAAEWERTGTTGARSLMSLAHALFSFGVVAGSFVAAWYRELGRPPLVLLLLIGAATAAMGTRVPTPRGSPLASAPAGRGQPARRRPPLLLLLFGGLVAVSFAVEDGLQSWTPLFLERSVGAGPAISALGVTVFAGAMGCGRLAAHVLDARCGEWRLLGAGGALGGVGVALLVTASSAAAALVGLALAGAGTSVLAPILLSAVGRRAAPGRQGEELALVNGLGYVGFIAGPPLVGAVTAVASMPAAFGLLGVLALLLGVAGPMALSSGRPVRRRRCQDRYSGVGTGKPLKADA